MLHGWSVDVEDWFHIIDCPQAPADDRWKGLESRVELGTTRMLDLLDKHQHRATFFILGWIAEHHPDVVAEIARRGHEIGSHSYDHGMVSTMEPDLFARDLDRSLEVISKAAGSDVRAFRAPGFSIGLEQGWALAILASRGIEMDASLMLCKTSHGGVAVQRQRPFELVLPDGQRLLEVPVVPKRLPARDLPYSGGGYLRLLPLSMVTRLFESAERDGHPVIAYIHPRELDPDQPRMKLSPWRHFKYYVGLNSVAEKLDRLFERFRFGTLSAAAAAVEHDQPLLVESAS